MTSKSPFTHDDVEQILKIVDRLTDVEVTLEAGDLKLHVRKGAAGIAHPPASAHGAPPAQPATEVRPSEGATAPVRAQAPAVARKSDAVPENAVAVRAPMLGTFYRAPSPAEPPFVKVGDRVSADAPIGVIEVMKLFNTIAAPISGTVVEVRAENGVLVEFNQILCVIRPD